ncbi:hypothetical protein BCR43DRAFT_487058 [Syncephalastrum racemosum]|uniref:BZIP domain-containing protein n=1 Tax=Syncephalastrum racemosum TaxID=13706 RepID=A0A1X2HRJ1_SYNRA|nr:hypothetical protein BCR43DRAFT_487058 [Syncephalastrum racemosum]
MSDSNNDEFMKWLFANEPSMKSEDNPELLELVFGDGTDLSFPQPPPHTELSSAPGPGPAAVQSASTSDNMTAVGLTPTSVQMLSSQQQQQQQQFPPAPVPFFPSLDTLPAQPEGIPGLAPTDLDAAQHRRSEDEEEYLSDSQLKMMTSKERRQLRNKISARKFRNRRKEYITMLEAEVQKQKAENNQLRLEVTWIRTTADKLQKENDQLRLELVLCKEGIKPRRQNVPSLSPPSHDSSSTASNTSPPNTQYDTWDLVIPSQQQQHHPQQRLSMPVQPQPYQPHQQHPHSGHVQQQRQNHQRSQPQHHHHTYLSHAIMPRWDLNTILEKEREQTPTTISNLFDQYPLLAPALMQIILTQTMTMTTNELMANAKLLPPPPDLSPEDSSSRFQELFFGSPKLSHSTLHRRPTGIISEKEIRSLWTGFQKDQMTQAMTKTEESLFEEDEYEHPWDTPRFNMFGRPVPDYCPLWYIQRLFCRFMYTVVIARYPQLEGPCQDYLPICEKFRRPALVM